MKHFTIIGWPRSGTTLLSDALTQHPDVICCNELFHRDAATRKAEDRIGRPWNGSEDTAEFVESFVWPLPFEATGFKLLYDQARNTNVWDYLESRCDVVILHVVRDNTLACYASGKKAQTTGKWHSQIPLDQTPVTITPDEAWYQFRLHDRLYRDVEHRFRRHRVHRVYYEDLCDDFAATLEAMYAALGVGPFDARPRLAKLATTPLRDRVANWNDLRAEFDGTVYERFFAG
jgi:LPS sulfotransferase NodH